MNVNVMVANKYQILTCRKCYINYVYATVIKAVNDDEDGIDGYFVHNQESSSFCPVCGKKNPQS